MKIPQEKYEMLLEAGRRISEQRFLSATKRDIPAIVLDDNGKELDAIVPDCVLYIACGEDCILLIDSNLTPQSAW